MARSNARLEVSGAGKTEDGLVQYNEEVNKLGDDLRELYETIRVNVDEEEQWKVFDFVEDFFMEELEIGDYINDINSYHLHMFDKHDATTKKFDAIVEKAGKVDANYAAQIEGYCGLLGEYGKKFEAVCAMLALDLIGVIPVIGALKYSDEIGTLFKNADKVSVVARSTDGTGVLAKHADEAGAWLHGVKVFRYLDETAEAVASGEKLLKESETIYESFADMMSSEDAKRYLDFLENGSREGLTSAELAGVEKADALLVSQKVGYEDVWDLRNAGDVLETSYGKSSGKLNWDAIVSKKGETRVDHINRHAVPNNSRETHGVFNGNPIDMVNDAWEQRYLVEPISDGMGGTIYNIPYKNAGYESGYINTGAQMDYITIVTLDESTDLITAFPAFGDYHK